jgi:O-antigen/teichoic acid export membrane protein
MRPVRAPSLSDTFHLLFSRIESVDHRRRRLLGMLQGVVTSLGNRIISVIVSFLSVPLTIGYLGAERYGVWITLGSLLAWLQITDFGLGNGLRNAVTTAAGQEKPELVRTHLSNGLLLLSAVASAVGITVAVAWPFIDWNGLFGVTSQAARAEVGSAVGAALAIFLIQFPLSVTSKVYMAYQEGRIGNYWGGAGNLLSLLALLVVTHTQGGLVWLVIAVSGASMMVNIVNTAWLFLVHKPFLRPRFSSIDFTCMRSLSEMGGQFFLIQIMALVTFSTDNFIISHFLGARNVPEYTLTYNLFNYSLLPQTILFAYLWTAYNEAIARRDIVWVRRTFDLNLFVGLGFSVAAAVVLGVIAKPFIGWWAGKNVVPSSSLVLWMAAWSIINGFTNPIACLLAAASHLRYQIIYSAVSSVANIALSLYLVQRWGSVGVIAATVMSYMVFVCGPVYVDARLLLVRLKRVRADVPV